MINIHEMKKGNNKIRNGNRITPAINWPNYQKLQLKMIAEGMKPAVMHYKRK